MATSLYKHLKEASCLSPSLALFSPSPVDKVMICFAVTVWHHQICPISIHQQERSCRRKVPLHYTNNRRAVQVTAKKWASLEQNVPNKILLEGKFIYDAENAWESCNLLWKLEHKYLLTHDNLPVDAWITEQKGTTSVKEHKRRYTKIGKRKPHGNEGQHL